MADSRVSFDGDGLSVGLGEINQPSKRDGEPVAIITHEIEGEPFHLCLGKGAASFIHEQLGILLAGDGFGK